MEEYYLHQPPHVRPQCMGCGAPKVMWHYRCEYCEGKYNFRVQMNHHLRNQPYQVKEKTNWGAVFFGTIMILAATFSICLLISAIIFL